MMNRQIQWTEKVGKKIPGRNEGMCKPSRRDRLWHEGSSSCLSWFFYRTCGKEAEGEQAGRARVVMRWETIGQGTGWGAADRQGQMRPYLCFRDLCGMRLGYKTDGRQRHQLRGLCQWFEGGIMTT